MVEEGDEDAQFKAVMDEAKEAMQVLIAIKQSLYFDKTKIGFKFLKATIICCILLIFVWNPRENIDLHRTTPAVAVKLWTTPLRRLLWNTIIMTMLIL